jgi:hypothetical protein
MLGVLVSKIVRKDVRWGLVGVFAAIALLLSLLSTLNFLPLTLYEYKTESPLSSYLTNQLVFGILEAVAIAALIAILVAAAEPIYRERFPSQLSLKGMFSRRGLRTKRFFLSIVLGYALTAFFFAYQAVFYVVAARLGAWAPADIPYSGMLNTAFPWATVLLIGFLPAVSEEGMSRMFSISWLDRLGTGRLVAVVLPAVIWGFGHAGYPNQPFYIRGIEVGLAGVVIGWLMLRYGVLPLLVWHFTVDAIYTALLLLRSGNAYYVVSGAIASGILLLPLGASLWLALRKGGFAPETGLTNGDEGFVPAPARGPVAPEAAPPVRPLPARALFLGGAGALLLATSYLLPARPDEPLSRDATGRARAGAVARAFLEVNGVSAERFRIARYLGTGLSGDVDAREIKPDESGRLPAFSDAAGRYVVRHGGPAALRDLKPYLPSAYWVIRFFEPGEKEEWKVLVDAERGRVVAFLNPKDEEAAAAPAPPAEAARRRARRAAEALGYPASRYEVIEVGSRSRPRRTDTTVVLEARPRGVGQARPRLTAVFHGARLAAFYPSLRVPESFLREDRKRVAADWILIGLKIVAIGGFVGIGIVLFLRIVRRSDFHWRRLLWPLLVAGALAAAAGVNALPSALRQYETELPFSVFQILLVTSLLLGALGATCAAGVGFTLFFAARPGWRRSLRQESLGPAILRAAIAAVGLAGLARWGRLAAGAIPALFEADPSLPQALERSAPAFAAFWWAATRSFGLAAMAAVLALAATHQLLRRPGPRAAGLAALLVALLPGSFRSPGDFAAELVAALLVAGVLALATFVYLRDSAAAWVLFGTLSFGGRAAGELLAQPAADARAAGWTALLLVGLAAAALLIRRGRPRPSGLDPAGASG